MGSKRSPVNGIIFLASAQSRAHSRHWRVSTPKGRRRKSEVNSRRVTAVMNAAAYQCNVAEANSPRMRNEQDTILFWEQKAANTTSRHTLGDTDSSLRRQNSIRRHSQTLTNNESKDAPRLS